jgi:hypothetical protein
MADNNYSIHHYYEWLQYSPVDRANGDTALELEREVLLQGFCDKPVTFMGRVYGEAPIKVETISKNLAFGKDEAGISLANLREDLDALFDLRRRVVEGRHCNDKLRIIVYLPEEAITHEYLMEIGSVQIGATIEVTLMKLVDSRTSGLIPALLTSQKLTPELPVIGQGTGHK